MEEDCLDPTIPTVDNTALECKELVSTDCIIAKEADTYLRYGSGSTLTSILGLISRAIQKLTTAQNAYLPEYKSYLVALDQDGTSDPIEGTVISNKALLTPTLTRTGSGEYTLVSVGSFVATKTVILPPNNRPVFVAGEETQLDKFYAERVDDDTITIKTAREVAGTADLTDGLLDGVNTILEIRIYK